MVGWVACLYLSFCHACGSHLLHRRNRLDQRARIFSRNPSQVRCTLSPPSGPCVCTIVATRMSGSASFCTCAYTRTIPTIHSRSDHKWYLQSHFWCPFAFWVICGRSICLSLSSRFFPRWELSPCSWVLPSCSVWTSAVCMIWSMVSSLTRQCSYSLLWWSLSPLLRLSLVVVAKEKTARQLEWPEMTMKNGKNSLSLAHLNFFFIPKNSFVCVCVCVCTESDWSVFLLLWLKTIPLRCQCALCVHR